MPNETSRVTVETGGILTVNGHPYTLGEVDPEDGTRELDSVADDSILIYLWVDDKLLEAIANGEVSYTAPVRAKEEV